jgi:hypothetical protein
MSNPSTYGSRLDGSGVAAVAGICGVLLAELLPKC